MIGVMPDTWGRGLGEDGHNPKGAVDAAAARYQVEPSLWRAVCCESSLHGSGRGGWKRAWFQVTRWPPTSLTVTDRDHRSFSSSPNSESWRGSTSSSSCKRPASLSTLSKRGSRRECEPWY